MTLPPPPAPGTAPPLLEVRDLHVDFATPAGAIPAVRGLSFAIGAGETLAVVGESGSGKSVTSLAIMGLLSRSARIPKGEILFEGQNLLKLGERGMRQMRGNRIGMVFQEPMTSLNPVHSVGRQIAEVIRVHQKLSARAARALAVEMLELVNIPEPARRAEAFPHEMSGGMRQRVMIAMALACKPKLLIADEPTTALDVTIQAQILELLRELQRDLGMSVLFITHDLGVVAEIAARTVVMYGGRAVETGVTSEIFEAPRMPYTAGLMASIPVLGSSTRPVAPGRLAAIPGSIPAPFEHIPGCFFAPRCGHAVPRCEAALPDLEPAGAGRMVRCSRWRELDLAGAAA